MAYINLNKYQLNGFITKKGREVFLKNGFNISQFGLGDSDINYLTLLNNGQGPDGNAETLLIPPLNYSGGSGNFITLPNVAGIYSGSCKISTATVEFKHHISVGDCVELVDELIIGQPKIYFEYTNIIANQLQRSIDLEIIYSNLPTDVEFTITPVEDINLNFIFPNGNRFIIPRGTGRIILPVNNLQTNIVDIFGNQGAFDYSIEPQLNFNIITPLNLESNNLIPPKRKIPTINYQLPILINDPIEPILEPTTSLYTNQITIVNNLSGAIELIGFYMNNVLIDTIFTNLLPLIPGTQTSFRPINSTINGAINFNNGITNFKFIFRGRERNLNARSIDIYNNDTNLLISSYNVDVGVVEFTTPNFIINKTDNLRIILRNPQ